MPSVYSKHDAVMKWAKGELGVHEEPLGSNRGTRVEFYQAHDWLPGGGYPWCASFVDTAWEVGGKRKLPFPSAGAWDLGNRARAAGWAVTSVKQLVAGDFVTFKAGAGHVAIFLAYRNGLVETIDGNVDNAVELRSRTLTTVRDLIHVPELPVAVPPKTTKPPVFEIVTDEKGGKVIYVSGTLAVSRFINRFLRRHPETPIRIRKKRR